MLSNPTSSDAGNDKPGLATLPNPVWAAAGLSANAWLMAQLEINRPVLHREEETWETVRFMDETGRENKSY